MLGKEDEKVVWLESVSGFRFEFWWRAEYPFVGH